MTAATLRPKPAKLLNIKERRLLLSDSEIHLWLTPLGQPDQTLIAAYRQLMNEEELERNQRYRFEYLRDADCIARALVRTVLSRYAEVEPTAWGFLKGEHGKPEISAPVLAMPLRFNLSHTREHAVCAVACGMDVGVDIECTARNNDVLSIADHYFSEQEVKDLFALPRQRQEDRFFDYWTLKEAYMKASGEGISLGLGNFSFHIQPSAPIQISFGPTLEDDPSQWTFWQYDPCANHRLAIAAKTAARPVTVRLFETIPLQSGVAELAVFE